MEDAHLFKRYMLLYCELKSLILLGGESCELLELRRNSSARSVNIKACRILLGQLHVVPHDLAGVQTLQDISICLHYLKTISHGALANPLPSIWVSDCIEMLDLLLLLI
jgi:hypothetical protein